MLLQDFYTTSALQVTEAAITASITFNAAHEIFKGHFPSIAVVPGVCMMQMVKEILEEQIHESLLLKKASQLKFLSVITPTDTPTVDLKLTYTVKDNTVDMQAELFNSERSFFKMKGSFEVA